MTADDILPREPWERRRRDRFVVGIALFVPLVIVGLVDRAFGVSMLGLALFLLLVTKLLVARRVRNGPREYQPETTSLRVTIVMPMHNEDPEFAVAAVMSMLAQSRPPDHLHVIDDGSTDGGAAADAVAGALRRTC